MSKRLIRTHYYHGTSFERSSASATLEGAMRAAVMRLASHADVDRALVFDERFGEVSNALAITIGRSRGRLVAAWSPQGLFPRTPPGAKR